MFIQNNRHKWSSVGIGCDVYSYLAVAVPKFENHWHWFNCNSHSEGKIHLFCILFVCRSCGVSKWQSEQMLSSSLTFFNLQQACATKFGTMWYDQQTPCNIYSNKLNLPSIRHFDLQFMHGVKTRYKYCQLSHLTHTCITNYCTQPLHAQPTFSLNQCTQNQHLHQPIHIYNQLFHSTNAAIHTQLQLRTTN